MPVIALLRVLRHVPCFPHHNRGGYEEKGRESHVDERVDGMLPAENPLARLDCGVADELNLEPDINRRTAVRCSPRQPYRRQQGN